MIAYIIKRLLQLIPVLFGISIITFTLSFIIPGDPVRAIMGQRSDREAELRIRHKFGLDRPFYVQYLMWVRNLIRNPGDLPGFKMLLEDDGDGRVLHFNFTEDTIFASDGEVREVENEPFNRKVLTHLMQSGCDAPDDPAITGGTTLTLIEVDDSEATTRMLMEDFQGTGTWFDVSSDLEVCTRSGSGDTGNASPGEAYTIYYRPEGFLTGREFNVIYDLEESRVIDGMYDEASSNTAEVLALDEPMTLTITDRRRSGGSYFFDFTDDAGGEFGWEMLPNAVLMLNGNRSEVGDFDRGMTVNIALTTRTETSLHAIYDDSSAGITEMEGVLSENPEAEIGFGRITSTTITPAVWFDFGRSYRQQREVRDIISGSFKNTAYLATVAMIIAIIVGIFAGIVSAVKPYSFLDYFTMTGALVGVSMPVFWLGLMLILLFQTKLGWITGIGYGEVIWHELNLGLFNLNIPWHQNVILPAITLATVPMAIIARMTRSSMLEVMNLDYIRTARAKGLREWVVIMRHALKNSLIPIITVIGVNFALLLAGAVLTETVFSWPGLGREIVQAIEFRDFPVVMAGVVLFAFVFVMVNLVVDILYAYVDPRIRYQ